ncbi:MAG: manganese-dependent inorganic pyrophosphatase [Candidatus Paceibacteria bacterium]
MIKVFGHISPDTDATCSALIWSWYINEQTAADATAYVLGDLNSETQFVLNRFSVDTPDLLLTLSAGDEVVIVDTNNPQELPSNINDTNILTLIDHHKLVGGLSTEMPPAITIRPVACTATVIHDLLHEEGITFPDHIKGLMLSAILSDTLEFRSPTTTPHDKDVAEKLAKELGITVGDLANEMFAAKSDISSFTDTGLIKLDSKKYAIGDKNFRVSVLETTNPETVLARKAGIIEAITTCVEEENDIDDVLLFIIDILKEEAVALTYNDLTKQIIGASFGVLVESDTEILPGIVSRKKQILPSLTL